LFPWGRSADYEGADIEPRHLDHPGFKVEDVNTFKKNILMPWLTKIPLFPRNPAALKAKLGSSCWRSASTASVSSPIPTVCPSTFPPAGKAKYFLRRLIPAKLAFFGNLRQQLTVQI
jgi:hypothetical protein